MKKAYTAPGIFYEDFSLTTNIAAECTEKTNLAKFTCGYEYTPDLYVFANGIENCDIFDNVQETEDGDYIYNGICYHVPYNDYVLFNS